MNRISYTQLSLFKECPLKWAIRYVEGIKTPQNVYMAVGDAAHQALASYYRAKASGTSMTIDETIDFYDETCNVLLLDVLADGEAMLPNKVSEQASAALRNYLEKNKDVVPMIIDGEPAIEMELKRIVLPDWEMIGYIDMIREDGVGIDYKIVGKSWGAKVASKKVKQALAYNYLMNKAIPFEFHLVQRLSGKLSVIEASYTDSDIVVFEDELRNTIRIMEGIMNGSGLMPDGEECNSYMCDYSDFCHDYIGGDDDI